MNATPNLQTILIVDDNPTNLEVLSETLVSSGFEVAVAIDGETALEQVSYQKPGLILLDIMMPGINGFETCRRLKQNPETKDIPIIFTTALSDAESKVEGLALGAVDYITKPFFRDEVLARVRIHLKLFNLATTLEAQNKLLQAEIKQRQDAESALCYLNEELEKQVDERTSELSIALSQLQKAQVQLVQNEKMSLLGQLVAGIAHEVNNPVNFIQGNIKHIVEYAEALLRLVALYQEQFPQATEEIQQFSKQIDLVFVSHDFPKMLSSIQIGVERICQIVSSLRNFSRLDEAEIKHVDLHEGIDNTLMILQHRLESRIGNFSIQITKDYSDLPLVECFSGLMNQVFMNLLSNAIDALEEKNKSQEFEQRKTQLEKICIRTEKVQDDSVLITISDSGAGIPEEKLPKIFDPFFTTRPVGKGTGLGLSITHQIITEKHKGKIWCHSNSEVGTEFYIQIPISQR